MISQQPPERASIDGRSERLRDRLESGLGIPFSEGNRIEPLSNGDEIFPAMLRAIAGARERIDFMSYVYEDGRIARRFAAALAARARAGVRVRVLLDALGAHKTSHRVLRMWRDAGVHFAWFRPLRPWRFWRLDHRNHRKVLVCDGLVGFTGGVGIGDQWQGDARTSGEWRELHFRIQGPALRGLEAAFLESWMEAASDEAPPIPAVPATAAGFGAVQVVRTRAVGQWNDLATLLRILLGSARSRLRITTPYFVPDPWAKQLLRDAAERGVEVEILLPGAHSDHRIVQLAGIGELQPLLAVGVKVWCYGKTMIHTKSITVDGALCMIGSANFDQRSLSKDDEISLVVLDPNLTRQVDAHFEADRLESHPLDSKAARALPRIVERATRFVRGQF